MAKFIERQDARGGREANPRDRRGRRDDVAAPRPSARSMGARNSGGRGEDGAEPGEANGKSRGNHDAAPRDRRPRTSAARAITRAKEYVYELTGQEPETVSGLSFGESGWKVTLDVVEMERIPRTTDVMASYELELDEQGELTGYRRLGRYYRSQVDQG